MKPATGARALRIEPPLAAIELGRDALGSVAETTRREWLVTNGIGGFAAGTLSLLNTRRYHGLLFAALRPPVARVALVAKLDVRAEYGGAQVPLASNEFADGTIAPTGYRHLERFRLDGLFPVWTWRIADACIEQRLWMRHGENTTYVQFTRIGGSRDLRLFIDPLCTYRDYHAQSRGDRGFQIEALADGVRIQAHEGARPYRILSGLADVEVDPQWHWNFRHREETARGLDDLEDLLRPARFTLRLEPGQSQAVVLTAEAHEPMPPADAWALERTRQEDLIERVQRRRASAPPPEDARPIERLALAADQFLVERRDPAATTPGHSVIAGYPWFSDWGRDTMIALPGLTLATGRSDIALSVLRTFAKFVDRGMLPNRFPDAGEAPEYNTVDASLWYFVAVHEYLRVTEDEAFAVEIYPILRDMLEWHLRGTRFGIRMDEADALLAAGERGVQLTWMDAKVGDWVVTARIGKPVEINALWFNAVCILRDLAADLGQAEDQVEYALLAERVRASFEQRFWYEAGGYLYDVIDGPEGEADEAGRRCDRSLRPNQIFALSLPHALLSGEKARRVLETCTAELWTPVGLRSLAPGDARYVGTYRGGPRERDGAYHQGTVWTWLIGPFAIAHYRLYGDEAGARAHFDGIAAHLHEGCVGQLSEIMDGDAPFEPKGCFGQAWAVAEVLRAWSDIDEIESSRQRKRETHAPRVARPASR